MMKIIKKYKDKIKMCKNKTDDGIHIRAVRFGYKHPNGFMYKDIKKWYSKREKDWIVVDKFLKDSFNNFARGLNHITPYILLEQRGNKNADSCRYTLSYEAYIQYFEYEKLQQTRKISVWAFGVAIATLVITLYSVVQSNKPTKINDVQYNKIYNLIKK